MRKSFDTPIEYEKYLEGNYLVLRRKKGKEETVPCPFCGTGHIHGRSDGHRIAHCASSLQHEYVTAPDGTILYQKHGYILRTHE